MLGALHHKSNPRNRHAHLMSMSSCFLTFPHYVQKSACIGVGWLRRVGHAKEERKERSKMQEYHSAVAEKKRDLVEVKSK